MNAPGVVVADTTPLNYLILIGRAEILSSLFGEVLIPQAVLEELRHPMAPIAVSQWLRKPPAWLRITPVQRVDETMKFGIKADDLAHFPWAYPTMSSDVKNMVRQWACRNCWQIDNLTQLTL